MLSSSLSLLWVGSHGHDQEGRLGDRKVKRNQDLGQGEHRWSPSVWAGVSQLQALLGPKRNMQRGLAGPVAKQNICFKRAAATWLQQLPVCRVARI